MFNKKQIGEAGEDVACSYLQEQGYHILDRNVSNRYGEIDLIASRKQQIHFIEIRTRLGRKNYGSALDSLTVEKLRRFSRTAEAIHCNHSIWNHLTPVLSVLTVEEEPDGSLVIEFLPDIVVD